MDWLTNLQGKSLSKNRLREGLHFPKTSRLETDLP